MTYDATNYETEKYNIVIFTVALCMLPHLLCNPTHALFMNSAWGELPNNNIVTSCILVWVTAMEQYILEDTAEVLRRIQGP